MSLKRAALATIAVALIGLAIAANLAYLHAQLAASSGYTSWCTINAEVNCDVVLASDYAYFLGVPVAVWAILTYAAMVVAAIVLLRSPSAARRRQMATALFAAAVWGVVFSAYLAAVSFFELNTVCVLCASLYVVHLGLLVSTAFLYASAHAAARRQDAWQGRPRLIAGASIAALLLLLGVVGWKASQGDEMLTADEIKRRDPGFYAWWEKLPTGAAALEGGHSKGQPQALVVITEFSDFECGHCATAYRNLKQILPRYKKDVQVRFHHFPLDSSCNPAVKHAVHKYACLAAMASECAAAQGRFWEYHDLLFEHQSQLDRDSLLEYARRVGLDRAAFLACLDSDAPRQAIARDVADGMRLGIESTPTFFLNGRTIAGAPRGDTLGYAIQLERAAKREG